MTIRILILALVACGRPSEPRTAYPRTPVDVPVGKQPVDVAIGVNARTGRAAREGGRELADQHACVRGPGEVSRVAPLARRVHHVRACVRRST